MPKPLNRAYSRYSREAIALLAQLIRAARLKRRMTASEVATRMGATRALIHRIEKGDPGCSVGAVFEAAAIVGVPLFDADPALESEKDRLSVRAAQAAEMLRLLPRTARKTRPEVRDDF